MERPFITTFLPSNHLQKGPRKDLITGKIIYTVYRYPEFADPINQDCFEGAREPRPVTPQSTSCTRRLWTLIGTFRYCIQLLCQFCPNLICPSRVEQTVYLIAKSWSTQPKLLAHHVMHSWRLSLPVPLYPDQTITYFLCTKSAAATVIKNPAQIQT